MDVHDLSAPVTTTVRLDAGPANRMAATLDREPTFAEGDRLPPGWHWLYLHEVVPARDLGPDGHPRPGVTMPRTGLTRRMWAGGRVEHLQPVRLGDVLAHTVTVGPVRRREGRSGPLALVDVVHELGFDGVPHLRETRTIVYRAEGSRPADGPPAPPTGAWSRHWGLDEVALFRYSALTFNGHRIHYDADWCRQVEGYPGLVVHGPLLATLLLDLAAERSRPLRSFTYRAVSPVTLPGGLSTHAEPAGRSTRLWVATEDGRLAMEATAEA